MRFSRLYLKTLKEEPKEAVVESHKLLLRSGMIKKLASGIYSYLPLGKRVLTKVENIVREEMDRAGAQEIAMPVLQPAEIWKETGRWNDMGAEMFRLKDRHSRDFILGPTHEEVITDIVRNDLSSYKALPTNLYQIQTKFRDERRPRFALMRGREFLMKDAYSFHATEESLDEEYNNMKQAYKNIFDRCGLDYRIVEADSGAIGGSKTEEFHVLAASGEDEIIYCTECGYAANLEKAESIPSKAASYGEELKEVKLEDTPNMKTIEEVANFLNMDRSQTIKAIMFKSLTTEKIYMVLERGDYEINEIKLHNVLNESELVMMEEVEIEELGLLKGFIGPYLEAGNKLDERITVVADKVILDLPNHAAGGNAVDKHYVNLNYGRDYSAHIVADIRNVVVGEKCVVEGSDANNINATLESTRGIEAGQVFKLGKKYSESMGATFLDENGKTQTMTMGCYGIGVSRTMAAAIEQNNDENGIIWPVALAPYIVDIIPANMKNEDQVSIAEKLYADLKAENIDTILDDRKERAGFKFKDADLIGFPLKVVVGKLAAEGKVEVKIRKTNESIELSVDDVIEYIKDFVAKGK